MGRDEIVGGLELEDGRIGGKAEVMEKVGGGNESRSAGGRGVAVAVAFALAGLWCGSGCVRTELTCATGGKLPEIVCRRRILIADL